MKSGNEEETPSLPLYTLQTKFINQNKKTTFQNKLKKNAQI